MAPINPDYLKWRRNTLDRNILSLSFPAGGTARRSHESYEKNNLCKSRDDSISPKPLLLLNSFTAMGAFFAAASFPVEPVLKTCADDSGG